MENRIDIYKFIGEYVNAIGLILYMQKISFIKAIKSLHK